MSVQYASFSTILRMPRICPSMRLSRWSRAFSSSGLRSLRRQPHSSRGAGFVFSSAASVQWGQAAAAKSALNGFTRELIEQHLGTCVAQDLKNGGTEKLEEFMWIMNKLM